MGQGSAARQGTDALLVDDAAELKWLRSENAELRMEHDVLKGYIAREVHYVLRNQRRNLNQVARAA